LLARPKGMRGFSQWMGDAPNSLVSPQSRQSCLVAMPAEAGLLALPRFGSAEQLTPIMLNARSPRPHKLRPTGRPFFRLTNDDGTALARFGYLPGRANWAAAVVMRRPPSFNGGDYFSPPALGERRHRGRAFAALGSISSASRFRARGAAEPAPSTARSPRRLRYAAFRYRSSHVRTA